MDRSANSSRLFGVQADIVPVLSLSIRIQLLHNLSAFTPPTAPLQLLEREVDVLHSTSASRRMYGLRRRRGEERDEEWKDGKGVQHSFPAQMNVVTKLDRETLWPRKTNQDHSGVVHCAHHVSCQSSRRPSCCSSRLGFFERNVICVCLLSYVPGWSAPTAADHSQGVAHPNKLTHVVSPFTTGRP